VDRELAPFNIWKEQSALSKAGQSGIAERALNNDEIKAVLASESLDQRDNTILRFLLGTGLRPNEVCGARWSEIDLEAGVWVVPKERMKYKGKDHKVALSEYVVDLLTAWRKTQKGRPRYVFPSSGSKYPHVVPDNLVERFKKLGVDGFSPKVCRATFRTGLQALGCPKEVRQHMSHHQAANKVDKSYDHHDYWPEAKHWWGQWGEHLSKLEAGKRGLAEVVQMGARA
jgi:integrase